jgi:endonuclease/exonuclease/phosphatase family metal-dependent hydrolase
MAAIGPVGYIYPRQRLDSRRCAALADALVREAHIPTVLFVAESGNVSFRSVGKPAGALPEDAADLLGRDHPFLDEAANDLVAMCRHREAGQIVLLGWCAGQEPLSFPFENGAHGGPGTAETGAFALLPQDIPAPRRGYFRGLDLREAVLEQLPSLTLRATKVQSEQLPSLTRRDTKVQGTSQQDEAIVAVQEANRPLEDDTSLPARNSIRVVTYNVHSCVGLDGKISTRRIARVIAQCNPDIVALQELDVRRKRTDGRDQAEEIARVLNMSFHFHPAIRLEEEQYGDAILSRFPMRLVHSGLLPGGVSQLFEPRGALWVELKIGNRLLQVINTHLGLLEQERLEQVQALLGEEWLSHPECREPIIICGDMNFGPRSRAYRLLAGHVRDVQLVGPRRPSATYPSRWPVVRIDHIFVRGQMEVLRTEPSRTTLARRASDHLPLIADLRLVASEAQCQRETAAIRT